MKAIRYGRQVKLPATELLRYTLSLDGVHTAVVGLDSHNHLNEDAAVASNFKPMKQADRFDLYQNASSALAGVLAPWDRAGYVDGGLQVRIEDEGNTNWRPRKIFKRWPIQCPMHALGSRRTEVTWRCTMIRLRIFGSC